MLYQCQVIDIHGISQGLELFVLPTIASLLIALLQSLPSSLTKLEILQLWTGDQTGEISRQIVGDIEEERWSGQTFQTAFFPWGGLICCRDQHGSPLMAGCSFEDGEVFQSCLCLSCDSLFFNADKTGLCPTTAMEFSLMTKFSF